MAPVFSFPLQQSQASSSPNFLYHCQYYPVLQQFSLSSSSSSSSSSSVVPSSPSLSLPPPLPSLMVPSNLQPPPQVAAEKRVRLPKKEPKNNYSSNNSSKYYRTSLSRVVMERERRKVLGDSIVALKELLPVRRRSTTSQMDKCTVLKEGRKHILDLKEELQVLAKKKEELTAMSAMVASQQYVNGSESVMVEEAMSAVTSSKKDDMMECRNRGPMFHDVVYNAPNVFVTLRIPEGRGVRLSRVFGAIEKANVDISNAMASWRDNDRSFCIMVHGKIGGKGASSIQALKQDLCRVSSKP